MSMWSELSVWSKLSRSFMSCCFLFQAEDGIRDLVRSRGLGDVYKRQDTIGRDVRYWLMKSEPDEFSIDDLVRAKGQTTPLSPIHI